MLAAPTRRGAPWALACLAFAICAAFGAPPAPVGAQENTAGLRGTVFDSTAMKVLPGARVAVLGTTAVVDADADGHFTLSGIPAGAHWVSFFHPRLQELGVSAPSRQIDFQRGKTVDVQLSVPSERTLLMGWCMPEQVGSGYGALAGVVVDSITGVPLPSAVVTVQPLQRRAGDQPVADVKTDESGYYRICAVPAGREMRVQPHFGQSAGRTEVVSVDAGGAQVRNLKMLLSAEGVLVGKVHDYGNGRPLSGAVVSVLGTGARQVTDSSGAFVLDGLPPGRHLVTTEYLGYEERTDSVTVFSQETVDIDVRMAPEALEVEGLVVTARTRFGKTRVAVDKRADVFTRAEIEPILARVTSMGSLLRNMNAPGLSVREVEVMDAAGVKVPGLCVEVSRRTGGSAGCNQAAVFLNDIIMPYPDQVLMNLDPGVIDRIEILSAIDAQFQYGTMAGNGAVLIYTR